MMTRMPAFINFVALATRRHCIPGSRYGRTLCARMASTEGQHGPNHDDNQHRFNEMEHRNWEQGYDAYDQGFGPLTRQTIPTLLTNAGFPPTTKDEDRTARLLDVATGPGFVLSAAIDGALTKQNQFHLTGLDITQNFLTLAEQRISDQMQQHTQQTKNIKVDFVEGSAEALPFSDNTFDSIVCNFGILHFFNPDVFLQESFRVLRPGGKVSFSAWAPPTRTEGFRIALESIAEAGNPNVEGLPDGPAFFDYGDSEQATKVLEKLGFENTQSVELTDMTWDNVQNSSMLYQILLNGTSRTREILLGQTSEETAAIQKMMEDKFVSITDGEKPLSMPAVVTSGQKPLTNN